MQLSSEVKEELSTLELFIVQYTVHMWRRDLLRVKVYSKITQHFPFNTRLQVSNSMIYGQSFLLYMHKKLRSLNSDLVEQRPTVAQVVQKGYKMIIFISFWWNLFIAQTCAVIFLTQPARYNELHLSYILYFCPGKFKQYHYGMHQNLTKQQAPTAEVHGTIRLRPNLSNSHSTTFCCNMWNTTLLLHLPLNCVISDDIKW